MDSQARHQSIFKNLVYGKVMKQCYILNKWGHNKLLGQYLAVGNDWNFFFKESIFKVIYKF